MNRISSLLENWIKALNSLNFKEMDMILSHNKKFSTLEWLALGIQKEMKIDSNKVI